MDDYIEHPAEIPIEYWPDGADQTAFRDPVDGGLAFYASEAIDPGTILRLRITCGRSDFRARVRVAWCRRDADQVRVGVTFACVDEFFQARMVEQACHIECYRRRVARAEGRHLTSRDAALEWIDKFAHRFPRLGET